MDFEDFSFYRMEIVDVYFVGGFGVMGWIPVADYGVGQPDPLADSAAGIIQHMNADHADALILMAQAFAGIAASEAVHDFGRPVGISCASKNGGRARGARIAFLRERKKRGAKSRTVLVEMTAQARTPKKPDQAV